MIALTLRDLRHDLLSFLFSVLGIGLLVFAFLLLVPFSLALTHFDESGSLPQNLILVERDALSPEQSRIPAGLERIVSEILGSRWIRVDPVLFRILRIEDQPIHLRGVAVESWESTFRLRLLEGAWPSGPADVVIGQLAASEAGWGVGSEVRIYGSDFRVAGITEGPGTKSETIWMDYDSARDLFGPRAGPQLLVVHLDPSADPLAAKADLEQGLASAAPGFDVYFEDALLREYGAAMNDLQSLSVLTAAIAVAAVTLGSHNLAWLAAEERLHRIGILRSLGFGRRAVAAHLLLRAGVISLASYLLALAAAILFLQTGIPPGGVMLGGMQAAAVELSPQQAGLGLALTWLAGQTGTWLSLRAVLNTSTAILLGRGPGASFA